MELIKVDIKTNSDDWNNYIKSNSSSELNNYFIAHNPCLAEIYEDVFGYKSEYYYLIENDKIVGLLPGFRIEKEFVSIPIFPTAGIFTDNLSKLEEWYSHIVEKLLDYEIRCNLKFGKYVYDKKINCIIYLKKDIEGQFSNFSTKLRTVIRRGYKNNITVIHGSIELLGEFYSIYALNMHHLGSPVLSYKFFHELVNNYKNGIARIFIARIDDKPIGCGLLLTYGKLSELGWASTISNFNKYKPNMVLYWEVIKYCIENSFEVFSFGRATKGSGSHNFKLQWGVTEVPIFFNYSNYRFDVRKLKTVSMLWRKIPLGIANKIGPFIRKITRI